MSDHEHEQQHEQQLQQQQHEQQEPPQQQPAARRGGPSVMYHQQVAVAQVAARFASVATDSTPTTPPSHSQIDIEGLCAAKRRVVDALPTTCTHCGTRYALDDPRTFNELRDGTVMAYCRANGACGKSLMLFAAPDLRVPVYRQVCAFDDAGTGPAPSDVQRLHGLVPDGAVCRKCNRTAVEHETGEIDQHGWKLVGCEAVALPTAWPRYDAACGRWL